MRQDMSTLTIGHSLQIAAVKVRLSHTIRDPEIMSFITSEENHA